jgi:hypothetical protein
MIGAGPKPSVKIHVIAGLWLEPAMAGHPLIIAGSNQEPSVMLGYHYRF